MSILLSYLQLIRSVNVVISFLAGLLSVSIAEREIFNLSSALVVGITAALTTGFGNIINDISDLEIDRINKPLRPLPSGRITILSAKVLACILCVGAILTGIVWLPPIPLAILFSSNIIIALYSLFLKKIPLIGNAVVAFFTGLVFIYGGLAVGNPVAGLIPAGFAFMSNFIREIVKTAEDVEGDSTYGIVTFPGKYGMDATKKVVAAASALLLLLTCAPFAMQWYSIEYFVIVMVTVNPLLVLVIRDGMKCSNAGEWRRISTILKLVMVFGLTAIAFGV